MIVVRVRKGLSRRSPEKYNEIGKEHREASWRRRRSQKRVEGALVNTVLRKINSPEQRLEGGSCGEAPGFRIFIRDSQVVEKGALKKAGR